MKLVQALLIGGFSALSISAFANEAVPQEATQDSAIVTTQAAEEAAPQPTIVTTQADDVIEQSPNSAAAEAQTEQPGASDAAVEEQEGQAQE